MSLVILALSLEGMWEIVLLCPPHAPLPSEGWAPWIAAYLHVLTNSLSQLSGTLPCFYFLCNVL